MLVRSIRSTTAVTAVSLIGLAALGGSACTDGGSPLVIRQNNAPGEESCIAAPSLTTISLTRGRIDTRGGAPFYLTPLVQNYASSDGGIYTAQRTILLEGARVEMSFVDGDLFTGAEQSALAADGLTRFESHFSAPVDPDEGLATLGFELIQSGLLEAIDGKLAAGESTLITTTTTIYGTMGGGDVESQAFPYTVEVCKGCLSVSAGACPLPADTEISPGDSCGGGLVTCCDDGGTLVCPAELAAPV